MCDAAAEVALRRNLRGSGTRMAAACSFGLLEMTDEINA